MADSRFRDQPEIFRRGLCEAMSPPDVRIVPCEACGGEGRIYIATGDDRETSAPQERDGGPCPYCEGTGGEIVEVEPITLEDLAMPVTPEMENQPPKWRYEIQHGPDNEADWAWVYDDKSAMVCVARTHHAEVIVSAMNAAAA